MFDSIFSAAGAHAAGLDIPLWLDLASVMVGSVSGILAGQERRLDLVGIMSLSIIGGLGGGLIRDMIMQHGVYMLESSFAIPAALATGLIGFLFPEIFSRHPHALEWVDMFSVALFVAGGTNKAIAYSLNGWASVLMGVITGVGGRMLRDICLGEVPRIFQKSDYYALCAVAGSVVYYICIRACGLHQLIALALCIFATVGLRRLSLRYNFQSHVGVNLEPEIGSAYHSLRNHLSSAEEQRREKAGEKKTGDR